MTGLEKSFELLRSSTFFFFTKFRGETICQKSLLDFYPSGLRRILGGCAKNSTIPYLETWSFDRRKSGNLVYDKENQKTPKVARDVSRLKREPMLPQT